MRTITSKPGFGIVSPFIDRAFAGGYTGPGSSAESPLGTITTVDYNRIVSPYLIQYHSETQKDEVRGQKVDEPLKTIDTSNRYGAVSAFLTKFYKSGTGQSLTEPLHTITTSPGHFGQISILTIRMEDLIKSGVSEDIAAKCTWVSKFVMEYYGCGTGEGANKPLHTIVTKDRFALITVLGDRHVLLDIYLRMLTPQELKMAQGFPEDYIIDRDYNWRPYPIKEQVARIGNSVVPIMAEALVRANCPHLMVGSRVANMRVGDDGTGQMRFA